MVYLNGSQMARQHFHAVHIIDAGALFDELRILGAHQRAHCSL